MRAAQFFSRFDARAPLCDTICRRYAATLIELTQHLGARAREARRGVIVIRCYATATLHALRAALERERLMLRCYERRRCALG